MALSNMMLPLSLFSYLYCGSKFSAVAPLCCRSCRRKVTMLAAAHAHAPAQACSTCCRRKPCSHLPCKQSQHHNPRAHPAALLSTRPCPDARPCTNECRGSGSSSGSSSSGSKIAEENFTWWQSKASGACSPSSVATKRTLLLPSATAHHHQVRGGCACAWHTVLSHIPSSAYAVPWGQTFRDAKTIGCVHLFGPIAKGVKEVIASDGQPLQAASKQSSKV
jgi:hypothetical protein